MWQSAMFARKCLCPMTLPFPVSQDIFAIVLLPSSNLYSLHLSLEIFLFRHWTKTSKVSSVFESLMLRNFEHYSIFRWSVWLTCFRSCLIVNSFPFLSFPCLLFTFRSVPFPSLSFSSIPSFTPTSPMSDFCILKCRDVTTSLHTIMINTTLHHAWKVIHCEKSHFSMSPHHITRDHLITSHHTSFSWLCRSLHPCLCPNHIEVGYLQCAMFIAFRPCEKCQFWIQRRATKRSHSDLCDCLLELFVVDIFKLVFIYTL